MKRVEVDFWYPFETEELDFHTCINLYRCASRPQIYLPVGTSFKVRKPYTLILDNTKVIVLDDCIIISLFNQLIRLESDDIRSLVLYNYQPDDQVE